MSILLQGCLVRVDSQGRNAPSTICVRPQTHSRAGDCQVSSNLLVSPVQPSLITSREHLRLMRAHEDILNEINRLSIERGLLRAHISNQVESASSREKLLVSELRQRASNRAALEDATEELNKELGKVVQLEETLYKKHASVRSRSHPNSSCDLTK